MMDMQKKYSIGLDIGVSSVGWACLTPDYQIPKFNGRYAMGVREFESAETAEARRIQRGTRRRYNRRIKRIQLLQETMAPLFKKHPDFLKQTTGKETHYWRNSNEFENNSLSEILKKIGGNPREYPTIHHLREKIIESNQSFDPRLIYIALHNLVKYRGHYLNENMTWNESVDTNELPQLLKKYFLEFLNHGYEVEELDDQMYMDMITILENKDLTKSDKRSAVLGISGKEFRQPVSLLVGLSANMSQLFVHSDNFVTYKEEKLKVSFEKEEMEEVVDKLTDEEKIIIEKAHIIYQNNLLKDLLGDSNYVSAAKVQSYKQFGDDLKQLKTIYNVFFGEKIYRSMFITPRRKMTEYNQTKKEKTLCEFDKFLKIKGKYEDKFYNNILKNIEGLLKEDKLSEKQRRELTDIVDSLNRGDFLQKQKGQMNAAIPHQNNVYEATTILKNQQQYHPEITDEMIVKVEEIIGFRIPYYIGPLIKNEKEAKFGWAHRKKEEHVTPWSIDQVIDRSQSAEKFITRMTSYCSYLTNEKVLPKHSLLYQRFEVLNELNGIQIRSNHELPHRNLRLGMDEKKWIIDNVFTKFKTVTHDRLKSELKKSKFKHLILDEDTGGLKGIYGTQREDRFSTNLSTHIDMHSLFGDLDHINPKMLEEIIYWISVFEEKDIIELKIKESYPAINQKQINQLINKNYTGWGRLSNKLLNEFPADKVNGLTIVEVMERNSRVFMEVLSEEKYNLEERISKVNLKSDEAYTKINYKDIKQLQGSPALKKGIWQAVLVIEELVDIFGEPENIMIEFAREDSLAVRTQSRKKNINDLQRAITKDEKDLKEFLKSHSQYEESEYRNERLYLYIIQQGKCLYSGEPLNIGQLKNYQVDHILPKSFVKDDSIIDNLALVTTRMNQDKEGTKMPLEVIPRNKVYTQKMQWKKLFENKLISQRKYQRLLKESFSDQDKESFFARQLVETRQITKHVKDLLNERFEHTEIHTVNANIVTGLRKHSKVMKLRNLNNKHHAIDAALSTLIIQFIINKYGSNFLNFNFKYQEARKKWREMFTKYKKNFFLFGDIDSYDQFKNYRTGEFVSGREFLSILNNETPWQTTKKIGSGEAAFYDETIYSPKDTKGKNPQYHSSKLSKGVHSSVKVDSSYLISFRYINLKGKEEVESQIVNYLIIERHQNRKQSEKELALFLAKKVAKGSVIDAKIHTKILKHQLIISNRHPLYFVSNKEMNNAKQFRPSTESIERIYHITGGRMDKENITESFLRETFQLIVDDAMLQYSTFLPDSRIQNIKGYVDEIIDVETFNHGLNEIYKMASASAARSTVFGGRYERRLDPTESKFIYQSITGLRHRKPKTFKKELWSK